MKAQWLGLAALTLTSSVSHAALTGADRARFLTTFHQACARYARSDERLSSVSRQSLITLCSCAGPRVADEIDVDQLFLKSDARTGAPIPSTEGIGGETVRALNDCLERRGGFMPGMTVTPNH